MTDQDPATPGAATLDLDKWDTCPCGSLAGPEFRYGLCDPCAERTPASALLRMGQLFGNAALAASKSVPEIERLKAENASILGSLREAEKEGDEEKARANRMLQLATSLLGIPEKTPDCSLCGAWSAGKPLCVDCAAMRLAAAEQRAEAAEKERDHFIQQAGDWQLFANEQEQRAIAAEARAAPHDEERSAPPQEVD